MVFIVLVTVLSENFLIFVAFGTGIAACVFCDNIAVDLKITLQIQEKLYIVRVTSALLIF